MRLVYDFFLRAFAHQNHFNLIVWRDNRYKNDTVIRTFHTEFLVIAAIVAAVTLVTTVYILYLFYALSICLSRTLPVRWVKLRKHKRMRERIVHCFIHSVVVLCVVRKR